MNEPVPQTSNGCKICGAQSHFFGRAQVLGKHEVCYYQCPNCGFIQTETPFWLNEAYSSAITSSDIGYIRRNLNAHFKTSALIGAFFDADAKFLDYGGGYGMLVRLMRDSGFDYYRLDRYCENLFATNFDAPPDTRNFELATAFEVFEHLVSPQEELSTMLGLTSSVFLSTTLLPMPTPALSQWWYYGLEHGQHVALYTHKALEVLAKTNDLNLVSDRRTFHLLTPKKIPELVYRGAVGRAARLINYFRRRPSLLTSDFETLLGKGMD